MACTPKELREILAIAGPNLNFDQDLLVPSPAEQEEMAQVRIKRRLHEILSKAAAQANPRYVSAFEICLRVGMMLNLPPCYHSEVPHVLIGSLQERRSAAPLALLAESCRIYRQYVRRPPGVEVGSHSCTRCSAAQQRGRS